MSPAAPAPPPLVSVVVPLYNGADHIVETLLAVAAQTYPRIEIIVVDDQSTDNGVALVRSSGVPVTLLQQANARVSAARNRGLAAASGEFVCFLDQDDQWFSNHVERQVRCFQMHPDVGAVFSPLQHWYPDASGQPSPQSLRRALPENDIDPAFTGWIYHQFLLDCWALTSATMIRRSALLAHGGFDVARPYSEDWELWLRLSLHIQFAKITGPAVLYRQHPAQGSRVARPVDYRTELLLGFAQRHGLASRDGRHVPQRVFDSMIARYQMDFGYLHLQCGQRSVALRSLLAAWRRNPLAWRCLALAAAAVAGWRPQGSDLPQQAHAS